MGLFGAPATNPGFTAAAFSSGGRGVTPQRGSGGVEELDLDLHLGLPYGEGLSSSSAGAVGEADFAGGRRGAAPSRAARAARAAMGARTGWGGAPAGTAARPYRAPRRRPANAAPTAAGGPTVGGRGGVGGGAGVAAGGQYADDGALGQESQEHAEWRKLKNGPPECLDNLEVMFEHTAADASSCVLGQHNSNEGDDGGDESDNDGDSDGSSSRETADSSSSDEILKMVLNRRERNQQIFLTMAAIIGMYYTFMNKAPRRKRERREMVNIMKEILETMRADSAAFRKKKDG